MKRALSYLSVIAVVAGAAGVFFVARANTPKVLSRKEIYRINCKAIIQIYVSGTFSGNGFITSANGMVTTANHVITTRDSKFREYANAISVLVPGENKSYSATPVASEVSADQINYDSAVLRVKATGLPHVSLGNWNDVDIGDSVFVISSLPGAGCLMLEGMTSTKVVAQTGFGPKPVNVIVFQAPIRNGFSGSPIFSSTGQVIGVEDTKVFGISPALSELRDKWLATRSQGSLAFMGIDLSSSFLELINNLDQNLISGLGSGVDIAYAKQQLHDEGK